MRFVRTLSWLVASLPIAAAAGWASFAARLPEPSPVRRALGEAAPLWDFAQWANVTDGPMHALAGALHLAALQVPGATLASVAWLNVFAAAVLAVALTGLVRRAFPASANAMPLALLVFGALVAAPAAGVDWLYGERVGLFLVPMSFVAGLRWLQRTRHVAVAAVMALVIAAAAPFCHTHGIVVGLALAPALAGAARRRGGSGWVWAGTAAVLGGVAAFVSLRTAPRIGTAGVDWLHTLTSAPVDTLLALLRATGSTWLDPLPDTQLDELALGGISWLAPFVLPLLGDRSPDARAAAAPWWSCLWFGLLLLLVAAVRFELSPPVGTLREATYGAFLVPVGFLGLLAARFGSTVLGVGAGAIVVLCLQDWHAGIEALRVARTRVDGVEAALLLPDRAAIEPELAAALPESDELARLAARGWVPAIAPLAVDAAATFALSPSIALGAAAGGNAQRVRGMLRSSLRGQTAQWLLVIAKAPNADPAVIATARPRFVGVGRDVPWSIELHAALPEASRLRVVGLLVGPRRLVALGPEFVVRGGQLVVAGGA